MRFTKVLSPQDYKVATLRIKFAVLEAKIIWLGPISQYKRSLKYHG